MGLSGCRNSRLTSNMAGFSATWNVQEREIEGTPGAEPQRALLASVESLGFYL